MRTPSEEPPSSSSAANDNSLASGDSSGRDTLGIATLCCGFLLLTLSLIGAYFQKPPIEAKPTAVSWLVQPQERNSSLRLPTIGAMLFGVHFDGPLRGWAVGENGTILHSTDGATWQPQTGGTRATDLYSIFGTGDAKTLWAVGQHGAILHSADGATWQPQTSGTTNELYSIFGTSDGRTLWAVGECGTILHSTDGATWQPQTSGTTNGLHFICGTNLATGQIRERNRQEDDIISRAVH